MSKGLPGAPRGTEPAVPAVVSAMFDVNRRQRHAGPPAVRPGQAEMRPWMAPVEISRPLLLQGVEVARHGHPGEELCGRDLFRRDPELPGGLTLRHPHSVVDEPGRVDLHPDRVGVRRVDSVEVQHRLEIGVHPFDAPAERVQRERLVGREPGGS
jgi:hypothetical protein